MALGARRDQLLQLMLFDGLRLRPALFGIDLGLLLSFAATRIFQSMQTASSVSWTVDGKTGHRTADPTCFRASKNRHRQNHAWLLLNLLLTDRR